LQAFWSSSFSAFVIRSFRSKCSFQDGTIISKRNCPGTNRLVCAVHFSDSGIDAGCGPERVTSRSVATRPFIHEHGGRLGCRVCVHHSMAQGTMLLEYPHHNCEFTGCAGLRVDGGCSPERTFSGCRSAGGGWVGIFFFRTLGSGSTRKAPLGERPPERAHHPWFAGGPGALGGQPGVFPR